MRKRWLVLLMICTMVLCFTGCGGTTELTGFTDPNEVVEQTPIIIMVEGDMWEFRFGDGYEDLKLDKEPDDSETLGTITSIVDQTEMPTKDRQANDEDLLGMQYGKVDGEIVLETPSGDWYEACYLVSPDPAVPTDEPGLGGSDDDEDD